MELHEELELYKKALIDFENNTRYTDNGFCFYFRMNHGIYLYRDEFKINLPYLYKQRTNENKGYWYLCGDTKPRIECLKRAIAEIETILNK
jgi:hypothetical protein